MGKVGEERLEKPKASTANVGIFIEKASRYTAIDRLTPELLRLFIQRPRNRKHLRPLQDVKIGDSGIPPAGNMYMN